MLASVTILPKIKALLIFISASYACTMRKLQNPPPKSSSPSQRLETADFLLISSIGQSSNLSRCAQVLGLSLSTVSRQLQALELKVGQSLIDRGKRTVSLTPAGSVLVDQAEAVLAHIAEVELALRGAAQQTPLRIQGTFGFGRQVIAPIITEFCRLNPQQRIELELADRDPDLLSNRFDIAVRFGQPPDRAVIARRLAPNRRFLVASPDYARAIAKTVTAPSDLVKVRCVALHQDNDRFSVWPLVNTESRPKQSTSVSVSAVLASNHGEVVKQWAVDGLGVALRSEFDVAPELRSGALVRILEDWEGAHGDIYAMYRPKRSGTSTRHAQVIANFLTFLQNSLKTRLIRL
jgi:LysR family transcriptional regulator, transcriptional activator for dmlA